MQGLHALPSPWSPELQPPPALHTQARWHLQSAADTPLQGPFGSHGSTAGRWDPRGGAEAPQGCSIEARSRQQQQQQLPDLQRRSGGPADFPARSSRASWSEQALLDSTGEHLPPGSNTLASAAGCWQDRFSPPSTQPDMRAGMATAGALHSPDGQGAPTAGWDSGTDPTHAGLQAGHATGKRGKADLQAAARARFKEALQQQMEEKAAQKAEEQRRWVQALPSFKLAH